MENKIYYQWYPYRFKGGYYIKNPTESALEMFYENVKASDPNHESFVLIMDTEVIKINSYISAIDEYVKRNVLPYFCNR
jgi:hypothetical protein